MKFQHVYLIILLLGFSCKETHNPKNELSHHNSPNIRKPNKKGVDVEDFKLFYNQFTSDSTFQMSRINFPLPGYVNQKKQPGVKYSKRSFLKDSMRVNVTWVKNKWLMYHRLSDSSYKQTQEYKGAKVIERTFLDNSEFECIGIFELFYGKWYLVYFSDVE